MLAMYLIPGCFGKGVKLGSDRSPVGIGGVVSGKVSHEPREREGCNSKNPNINISREEIQSN